MTDTTEVSTLTNNSVSFDISGLRHFEEGDKIWFCLVDIGRMLEMEYSAVRKMKSNDWFDSDEINTVKNFHGGADITYVSESALYRIINRSNSPKARPFERWVTKEVLPSIRKTGSYSITKSPIERILANSVDQLEAVEAIKEVLLVEKQKQALIEARADKAEEAKAIAEQERDDVKEAFSRSVVSDNDKLYSTFIKELKMTNPCASSLLKELKIFGQNGHLSDYGDWFKVKVSDNGFPARFVTKLGQEMLIKLFNNNRDKMRAINGTYRYIKPQDRFKEIPEIVYM